MPKNAEATSTYNGYSLFNDIEDSSLKARNRGVVMANMMEDNLVGKKVSTKGMHHMLKYMSLIPLSDRGGAMDSLKARLKERHIDYS